MSSTVPSVNVAMQSALFPLDAVITPFLKKLLTLTTTVSTDIAGWDENGSIFIIKDGKEFEKLLRNYFKGTQQTFIRQLHFYGFSKSDLPKLGSHAWSFSHPCFLRDAPGLVVEIKRKSHGTSPLAVTPTIPSKITKTSPLPRMESFKVNTIVHNTPSADDIQLKQIHELKEQVQSLQQTTQQLLEFIVINMKQPNKKQKIEVSNDNIATPKLVNQVKLEKIREPLEPSEKLNESFLDEFIDLPFADLPMIDNNNNASLSAIIDQIPLVQPNGKKRDCSHFTDEFITDLAAGFADDIETPPLYAMWAQQ